MLLRIRGASLAVQGIQSTFRGRCPETANYRDVPGAALAHTLRDKTEAA
jgi:hypothetical protein